jgi:two-component sensor histidine kinase
MAEFPYLLPYGVVIICAVLFDQRTSLLATILSAATLAFFVLEPRYSFAIESTRSAFSLAFFIVLSLFVGFLIELLHLAIFRLHETNDALRRVNRELTASDREKDLLLREAAHRTKNDLLTLIAIIRLEQRRQKDQRVKETLERLAQRTQVYVKLQERLSRSEHESVVDVGAYLKDLCDQLASAVSEARPIELNVAAENHTLPASQALAIGLITNELVTNALKHAFGDDEAGRVHVVFQAVDGEFVLTVEDDGKGLPAKEKPARNSGGDGQRLVQGMVSQLQGAMLLQSRAGAPGTFAKVTFPSNLDTMLPATSALS